MSNPADDPPCEEGELDALVDSLLASYAHPGAPGGSVGVFHRGRTLFQRACGLALLEPPAATGTRTNYRLASLTKQFTATAILILVERGALALDTAVREVLPELRDGGEPVRVHHLLTHTSGVWDYEDLIPTGQTEQVGDGDVLAMLAGCDRRYFGPGESFRYSNSGYALLATVVERRGGGSFADFLRERIFRPLGMHTAVAYEAGLSSVPERAYGYAEAAGGFSPADQDLTSAVLADGGVYASVADLACWEDALVYPHLLSPATLERMWSPAKLRDGTSIPYGYGWYVDVDRDRRRLTHHGESIGFRSAVIRYPREQLGVWVLTNRSPGSPWELAQRIADGVLARLGTPERAAPAPPWPFHDFG
jgi:CubicO group peptidase (beta-lactamase class C family)